MTISHRLAAGGLVDRSEQITFTFDGKNYTGFAGDTVASALLANGVRIVGRSFKYHRPRGVFGIGAEEPNALLHVGSGARREPNTRAPSIELRDGLTVTSQHSWPSLKHDIGVVNGWLSPFIPAGFYYKTFIGPTRKAWMFYEAIIRRAAGLGAATREPDPDHYERMHAHCDVAIIGGGAAGLSAALAAAKMGARVIVTDEGTRPGGWLLHERAGIEGSDAQTWVSGLAEQLASHPNVQMLTRTTAFGIYDHGEIGAVERVTDHLADPAPYLPRQRYWKVFAKRIVLATGAIEQPLAFEGNDRPGVMLASAVRGYLNRYAVVCGHTPVVATTNDSGYLTAFDLADAGVAVAAIVDARVAGASPLQELARDRGLRVITSSCVTRTNYRARLDGVEVSDTQTGARARIPCDLVAVAGGLFPTLHLSSHLGHKPVFDETRGIFLPSPQSGMITAGSCAGIFALRDCLSSGSQAGVSAAIAAGFAANGPTRCPNPDALLNLDAVTPVQIPPMGKPQKIFVDFQNDVTVRDVELAHREGYTSVEHLKRYTTLGMGTDQGKTANLAGLTLMASALGLPVNEVGTTTFRPPYTPIATGALTGPYRQGFFAPLRRTPMQVWHEQHNAVMAETGMWRRPKYYRGAQGEPAAAAIEREALAVRGAVGLVDVSTLGKIEVAGPDAEEFLHRIYCTPIRRIRPGRASYAVMLREDGIVLDDGVIARLAANRFYLTTTTAHAAKVLAHLEYHAQVEWPHLRVAVTSVTDAYGAMAVAGPQSLRLLERLGTDIALSDDNFTYGSVREGLIKGAMARILRVSYSGERAYEIHVEAAFAEALWRRLCDLGRDFGLTPYGTEAMGVLRIEKGHVAGPEIDGRTTISDLGLGGFMRKDRDFVGAELMQREGLVDAGRPALVGLVAVDGQSTIRGGAQITAEKVLAPPHVSLGHVTSACRSPSARKPIALALVSGGKARHGDVLYAQYPLKSETVAVRVVSLPFVDPEGERLHA
mgnify:CR=1 FL=1